jgi:DNA-binding NtrC family response regulator
MPARSLAALLADPAVNGVLGHLAWLPYMNPFDPRWNDFENILTRGNRRPEDRVPGDALARISGEVQEQVARAAAVVRDDPAPAQQALWVYGGAAIYALWDRYRPEFQKLIDTGGVDVPFREAFEDSYRSLLLDRPDLEATEPRHLLGLMYQWQRIVFFTATKLRGFARSAAAARAAIYQAVRGSTACTYARGLYRSMEKIPVLITGEMGTGKEVAAQCIGWGGYIPLDKKGARFVVSHREALVSRNLAEVPPSLVGGELFGHVRGSFTGAIADRDGLFTIPGPWCALFLDEIGEILLDVQAALLRPEEVREIVPYGASRARGIYGRHLFATNKDLPTLCLEGKFRPDLLARLSGVRILMPPARQMFAEDPDDLARHVFWTLEGLVHDQAEAWAWTARIVRHVAEKLPGYTWPGNMRELRRLTERYLLSGGDMPAHELLAPATAPAAEPPAAEVRAYAPVVQTYAPVVQEAREEGPATVESRRLMLQPAGVPSSGYLGPRAKGGGVTAERMAIVHATDTLARHKGNVSKASEELGIGRARLRRLIDRPRLARKLRDHPDAPGAPPPPSAGRRPRARVRKPGS